MVFSLRGMPSSAISGGRHHRPFGRSGTVHPVAPRAGAHSQRGEARRLRNAQAPDAERNAEGRLDERDGRDDAQLRQPHQDHHGERDERAYGKESETDLEPALTHEERHRRRHDALLDAWEIGGIRRMPSGPRTRFGPWEAEGSLSMAPKGTRRNSVRSLQSDRAIRREEPHAVGAWRLDRDLPRLGRGCGSSASPARS